jgi:hypothetical protein
MGQRRALIGLDYSMAVRAVSVWLVMLIVASANGALRQAVLIPLIGEVGGRAISTLVLAALLALLTWLTIGWIAPRSGADAWLIGAMWVALTLAFEFLAGHYLFGTPWSGLVEDYNVLRGRIWIVVLLVTGVAPRVAAARRGVIGVP